jgi:prolyl-tRNA synthetase
MLEKAKSFREENTRDIDTWDDFVSFFTPENKNKPEVHGGFARAHWCGDTDVEQKINDELSVTVRCIPQDEEAEPGECMVTGKPSPRRVVFAKSY